MSDWETTIQRFGQCTLPTLSGPSVTAMLVVKVWYASIPSKFLKSSTYVWKAMSLYVRWAQNMTLIAVCQCPSATMPSFNNPGLCPSRCITPFQDNTIANANRVTHLQVVLWIPLSLICKVHLCRSQTQHLGMKQIPLFFPKMNVLHMQQWIGCITYT